MSGISIAKSLEWHLAQPGMTREQLTMACQHAADAHLAAVSVWPVHVAQARTILADSDTRIRAAISFPWGQDDIDVKIAACDRALHAGAHELAVMLDHSQLTARGDVAAAIRELDRLLGHAWWSSVTAARGRRDLTIVLDTPIIDEHVLTPLAERCADTDAGFVQIGTGCSSAAQSLTERDVHTLRALLPDEVAIIATGSITTLQSAHDLINAGAVRIGSTAALSILDQERSARPQQVASRKPR